MPLVTNILSSADKARLDAMEDEANKYVHPATHSLDEIDETEGLKVMTAAERTKLASVPAGLEAHITAMVIALS